jgi:hypothetical protein
MGNSSAHHTVPFQLSSRTRCSMALALLLGHEELEREWYNSPLASAQAPFGIKRAE